MKLDKYVPSFPRKILKNKEELPTYHYYLTLSKMNPLATTQIKGPSARNASSRDTFSHLKLLNKVRVKSKKKKRPVDLVAYLPREQKILCIF